MAFSVAAYAAPELDYVMDDAQLLSEGEAESLNSELERLSGAYGAQIVVMTVPEVLDADVDWYINTVYDEMNLGYGSGRDGVLLVVCMNPREFRILTNGMADEAIGMSGIDSISDDIVSDLSEGDYDDAFETFAERCQYYLDGYVNGFPFNFGQSIVIALACGLVAGIAVAFILKGQLKSVRRQELAHDYVKPGSMNLTASNDLFLYSTVDRQRRESSSSKSSGSSRSVGGRSF